MSDRLAELMDRKRLLVARSRLHRLELQHGVARLRETFARPGHLISMATSSAARPLIFGLLMMLAGRSRLGRLLRGAMTALSVVKAMRELGGGSRFRGR
jgi:hypothetical protein